MRKFPERKWTDTQRAAIARETVDAGRSIGDAIRDAREGKLAGLEPFDMPYSTAADIRRRELRRRARAKNRRQIDLANPAAAAQAIRARTLALAEGMLARAEKQLEQGKLDPAAFKVTSTATLDIARRIERDQLDRPCNGGLHGGKDAGADPSSPDTEPEPDLLDQLAQSSSGRGKRNGSQQQGQGTQRRVGPHVQ